MTDYRAYVQQSGKFSGHYQALEIVLSYNTSDLTGNYTNAIKEIRVENSVIERVPEGKLVPRLLLNEDAAKALMIGLMEYFGEYKGDIRILRQDYIAERKRVDKFIDYMIRPSNDT